jgi:hypothetical protein
VYRVVCVKSSSSCVVYHVIRPLALRSHIPTRLPLRLYVGELTKYHQIYACNDQYMRMGSNRRPSMSGYSNRRPRERELLSVGLLRDPTVIPSTDGFVNCSANGCIYKSSSAEYPAMMLRLGFRNCIEHMDFNEVTSRIDNVRRNASINLVTVIFYDLELSRDGQIEQISALTDGGGDFSRFIRTSVRTNTSPLLRRFPPMIYTALACEPRAAMESFVEWIRMQHVMNTNGDTNMDRVVLVAHYGSCHDHVYLMKTMMSWGVEPPHVRFSDSLALFKLMKGTNNRANLSTLVATYTPWIEFIPHDADNDVRALRAVVMTVFPNVRLASLVFSISYTEYMRRTGLDMHEVVSVYAFVENSSFVDPDLDELTDSVATSE